jgi:hypothetical protein
MPVTITFQGLCGLVSETADVAASRKLDVLLVDAIAGGLGCVHEQKLDLPAANLDDPRGLTEAGPDASRRILRLAGRNVKFLLDAANQTGFETTNLQLIPEMRQVSGIGTVHSGCFETPPTRPVSARVELPGGGKLSGDPNSRVSQEWSFAPPVNLCYHERFAKQALLELPPTRQVVLEVETLNGTSEGSLTLRSTNANLTISNLCTTDSDPLNADSDDTLVFFKLIEPPFSGALKPRARSNATCDLPVTDSPGIGCVPFLLSRN